MAILFTHSLSFDVRTLKSAHTKNTVGTLIFFSFLSLWFVTQRLRTVAFPLDAWKDDTKIIG